MRTSKELFDEYDEELFWREKRWLEAERNEQYEQLKGELNKRVPLNFSSRQNVRNFGSYKIPRYAKYNTGHISKIKRERTKSKPFVDSSTGKRRGKNRLS